MPAGGFLTAGGLGLGETVVGLINKGKAKSEAAKLQATRPKYTESPYYKDALSLAESEVSTGMSGAAKTAYEQGIDKDLSSSLNAILKSGGSANNVAEVFSAANQGRQKLAIMKDNLRLNQINNLVRSQQLASEEREKAFQFNQWAPWADEAKANAEARTAAEGQIWGGLSTAGAAAMGYAQSKKTAQQLNDVLSPPAGSSSSPTLTAANSPGMADIGGMAPSIAGRAGPFISPNVRPLDINVNQYALPDMSSLQ